MKINEITALAVDKWDYLFQSLGIEVGNGKHCPCPACGGKDRFRFDNKDGRGTYICNQCGSGDGLELIKRYFNCDAKAAAKKVAEYLNLIVTDNHNKEMRDNPVCKKVEYLLSQSKVGQSEYLINKGITFNLPLLDGGKIIAPLLNLHNEYTGAQFIEPNGTKQLMKGTNKIGSFIAVLPYLEEITPKLEKPVKDISLQLKSVTEIIICEGLATGITIAEFRQRSIILSAIDAGNLIHVARAIRELNPTAKIIIAGDNDIGVDKNVGKDKAIEAANFVNCYYAIPDTDFKSDWDDYRQKYGVDKAKQDFDKNIKKSMIDNATQPKQKAVPDLSQMQASQKADVLIAHYDNNLALDMVTNEVYSYKDNIWQMISEMDLKRELVQLFRQSNAHYSEKGIKSTIDTMKLQIPLKGGAS